MERKRGSLVVFIICVAIPLLVGALAGFLTKDAPAMYGNLNKPPLSPPGSVFPVVWTVLYLMMGVASYFIYRADYGISRVGLILYGIQLVMNFCWSLVFFRAEAYWFAAFWLLAMILVLLTLVLYISKATRMATILLIPYLGWCCFAFYLNVATAILNEKGFYPLS